MGKAILIVEGDYDLQLLPLIVPNNVLVVRGAGKNGMRAFMQGYRKAPGATAVANLFAFRDRDFDFPIPEHPEVTDSGGNIWVSYRRTIENYLLTPEGYSVFRAADSTKTTAVFSEKEFSDILQEAASQLRYYQAARQALGEMRRQNRLGTTWTDGSGHLPEQLDKDYCGGMAKNSLQQYQIQANEIASLDQFENLYESYCNRFDSAFLGSQQFQIWFQAKDMQKQIQVLMGDRKSGFPWKTFYKYAIDNFDFKQFEDLVQFRQILENIQS